MAFNFGIQKFLSFQKQQEKRMDWRCLIKKNQNLGGRFFALSFGMQKIAYCRVKLFIEQTPNLIRLEMAIDPFAIQFCAIFFVEVDCRLIPIQYLPSHSRAVIL
jgi:hypothetical protein